MPFEPLDEAAPLGQGAAKVAIPSPLDLDPSHQARKVKQTGGEQADHELKQGFHNVFPDRRTRASCPRHDTSP